MTEQEENAMTTGIMTTSIDTSEASGVCWCGHRSYDHEAGSGECEHDCDCQHYSEEGEE